MLRKALRGIAVALILMPEPVTTAIGLMLLGVAFLLSRSRRLSSKPYLRELIKFYLHQTRAHSRPARIVHHSLKERLATYDVSWHRPPGKKVTHHAIDDARLQRRYGARLNGRGYGAANRALAKPKLTEPAIYHSLSSRWASYEWPQQPVTPDDRAPSRTEKARPTRNPYGEAVASRKSSVPEAADKVIYHNLKTNLSGYVLPTVLLATGKTVQHTIDMVKLERYYGRVREERETAKLSAEGKPKTPERIILRHYKATPAQLRADRLSRPAFRAEPAYS